MTLQARGEGLAPINTSAGSESFVGWLEREGYTDIRWVEDNRGKSKSEPRRVVRRPRAPEPADRTDTARPRRVVRRPSAKSG